MPADTCKPVRKANEKATHRRSSKAREVRILKSKKRKRTVSSEGSSEPGKKSEEEDKKTDEDVVGKMTDVCGKRVELGGLWANAQGCPNVKTSILY
jgi:hypothetical protein